MTLKRSICLLFGSVLTMTLAAAPADEGNPSAERPAGEPATEARPVPAPCEQDEAATWPVKTLTLLLQLTDEEQLYT